MAHLNKTDESKLSLDQILSIRPLIAAETPQWSPDGARILFVSSQGTRPSYGASRPMEDSQPV